MKFVSFNVNGVRASVGKGLLDTVYGFDADFFCIQETKAQDDQVATALEELEGYRVYSNSAVKKGYSGVAILAKEEPVQVMRVIGIEEHDQEGRVLTLEYNDFFLVNVYVPNSGSGLKRLDYRSTWDQAFAHYLADLQKQKPLVVTGDFNVAHEAIDLKNDKANYNKTSGFTQVEIDGLDGILDIGLADTFRRLHPEVEKYSFWSMRFNARKSNAGWRIDYFLVSEALMTRVTRAEIHNDVFGSDHCPVSLEMAN